MLALGYLTVKSPNIPATRGHLIFYRGSRVLPIVSAAVKQSNFGLLRIATFSGISDSVENRLAAADCCYLSVTGQSNGLSLKENPIFHDALIKNMCLLGHLRKQT